MLVHEVEWPVKKVTFISQAETERLEPVAGATMISITDPDKPSVSLGLWEPLDRTPTGSFTNYCAFPQNMNSLYKAMKHSILTKRYISTSRYGIFSSWQLGYGGNYVQYEQR